MEHFDGRLDVRLPAILGAQDFHRLQVDRQQVGAQHLTVLLMQQHGEVTVLHRVVLLCEQFLHGDRIVAPRIDQTLLQLLSLLQHQARALAATGVDQGPR